MAGRAISLQPLWLDRSRMVEGLAWFDAALDGQPPGQQPQAWLQVGGHGDPGETDPLAVALREAAEETGLTDLVPWPDAALRHVRIVPVPAGGGEPAHEHADLRFVLATSSPEAIRAEPPDAPLRWLTAEQAAQATSEDNFKETLSRVQRLLDR